MPHEFVSLEVREPYRKLTRQFGGLYEECAVCKKETPFWYERIDIPLCLGCADCCQPHDIPSKRDWLRSLGFILPDDWTPHADR